MSSLSCVTFETFVPGASRSSWRVTLGPVTRPTTLASMPKWPSVSTRSFATCSWFEASGACPPLDWRRAGSALGGLDHAFHVRERVGLLLGLERVGLGGEGSVPAVIPSVQGSHL